MAGAAPQTPIERFRRVVASAYAQLEERRQEVNDLNVFPVADGDTGDNMALTLRAVLEELDSLDGREADIEGREAIVREVARAALMGARGNSGVILSQIVRGAAEELASRPGELVDPVLIASALARAADAAYESVRDPVEGTMLTVAREMAHAVTQMLAHMENGRLAADASDADQDELLAAVLETALRAGEEAVKRTPEQLDVLGEAGVVDAGGHGLVLMVAGVIAGLRGDAAAIPEVSRQTPARLTHPHHEDSRYRYCTNFIVTGTGLDARSFVPRLEEVGDSVLVVGDAETLKIHVHTDDPDAALALFEGVGEPRNLDVADMREQIAARLERLRAGRCGVVAVVAGEGLRALYEGFGAYVVDGALNPSTSELLAGIHAVPAPEVLVLPNNPNVVMAAERAAGLSEKPVRVVGCTAPQAGLSALVELDTERPAAETAQELESRLAQIRTGGVASAARDDAQGRFVRGDAVGFIGEEIVAWGGAGSTLAATIEALAAGAEIVTVYAGEGAPLSLGDLGAHAPDGIELDVQEGGQPHWWWLLAAE